MTEALEQTGTLLTSDGLRLFYREWTVSKPRAFVSIVHGLGEHSARYRHVAVRLNALGINVRAHDQRGHGRSEGRRGYLHRSNDLLTDLKLVFDDYSRQSTATPYLLGHSLGGLVAARFALEKRSALSGLILSSPALAIHLSAAQRILLKLSQTMAPGLAVSNGLDISGISHDLSVVEAYISDPLNHGKVTPRLIRFMQDSIAYVMDRAPTLHVPVLMLVAGSDRLVVADGSKEFFARLTVEDRVLQWYPDAYHELFNEIADRRARALSDLTSWFDQHIAK